MLRNMGVGQLVPLPYFLASHVTLSTARLKFEHNYSAQPQSLHLPLFDANGTDGIGTHDFNFGVILLFVRLWKTLAAS